MGGQGRARVNTCMRAFVGTEVSGFLFAKFSEGDFHAFRDGRFGITRFFGTEVSLFVLYVQYFRVGPN